VCNIIKLKQFQIHLSTTEQLMQGM
jgi:hypothetical protein